MTIGSFYNAMENFVFNLDEERLNQVMDGLLEKEQEFRKKTWKPKMKKKPHWSKVYEQLRDEDLKKKGYLK